MSEVLEANGLYYLAGDFSEVGGEPRTNLAAIDVATGHVDPTFAPVISNPGGGNFTVDGIALSPDEQDLYIGGTFTNVNGSFQTRLAKLDAITGAVDTTFDADISARVDTIATDGTSVWVGGNFATVDGVSAPNLVKLDATTGDLDPNWVGTADLRVLDIELDVNNVLWVGGNFDNIAGTATKKLAPLDPVDGNVIATWVQGPSVVTNPPTPLGEQNNLYVVSPAPDGSAVYVGTRGTPGGNPQAGNAIRKYSSTGELLWQVVNAGDVQALEATATTVYAAGHGDLVYEVERYNLDGTPNNLNVPPGEKAADMPGNGLPVDSNPNDVGFAVGTAADPHGYVESPANPNATVRSKLWALDPTNGDLLPWDPNLDTIDGVWGLEVGPSGLLVSGDFRNIVNPTGVPGQEAGVFSPHFAVFASEGNTGTAPPQPVFTVECNGTSCDFDGSASSSPNGAVTSYVWDFGDGQTATGATGSVTLADDIHQVSLTVTDAAGLSFSRTQQILVGDGGALPIEHVATEANPGFFNSASRQIPANAQAGDVAIAFVSVGDSALTVSSPAGWTQFGDETDGNLRTFGFWKVVTPSDPNSNQVFPFTDAQGNPATIRSNITLSVFGGVSTTTPIAAVSATPTPGRTAQHQAPALSFTGEATVLHFFAERTSNSTEIFASPELATISTSIGAGNGGGYVNTAFAFELAPVTANSVSRAAVAEHPATAAHGWSLALFASGAAPDTVDPTGNVTTPANGSTTPTGTLDIQGTASDDNSGVNRVLVQVRRLTNPTEYWNGTTWTTTPRWNTATLNGDGTWTLPAVNFDQTGDHAIALNIRDNANNVATSAENPLTNITIN